jgi:hypothetical protein
VLKTCKIPEIAKRNSSEDNFRSPLEFGKVVQQNRNLEAARGRGRGRVFRGGGYGGLQGYGGGYGGGAGYGGRYIPGGQWQSPPPGGQWHTPPPPPPYAPPTTLKHSDRVKPGSARLKPKLDPKKIAGLIWLN